MRKRNELVKWMHGCLSEIYRLSAVEENELALRIDLRIVCKAGEVGLAWDQT